MYEVRRDDAAWPIEIEQNLVRSFMDPFAANEAGTNRMFGGDEISQLIPQSARIVLNADFSLGQEGKEFFEKPTAGSGPRNDLQ